MTGLKYPTVQTVQSFEPPAKEYIPKTKFQNIINSFIPTVGIGRYVGNFCGVSCFASTVGELKNRAAIALPGVGIFIHPNDVNNLSLLRHEFGHILQAKKWGKRFFYRHIAKESILSADRANRDREFIHQHTWTEWTANRLSYYFFRRPNDWDMKSYPICPPLEGRPGSDWPEFLRLKKTTQLRHISS